MGRRLTDQERLWRAITEAQHQQAITDIATMYGWKYAHFADSRKAVKRGNRTFLVGDDQAAGYPDLTLVHRRFGAVWIEVKREKGTFRDGQEPWLDALIDGGQVALVSRPSRMDDIERWLRTGFPTDPEVLRILR